MTTREIAQRFEAEGWWETAPWRVEAEVATTLICPTCGRLGLQLRRWVHRRGDVALYATCPACDHCAPLSGT